MYGDLDLIVAQIAGLGGTGARTLVAIDGIGASGKTAFTARIATLIQARPVVVLHVDDFFNPSVVRHARGRQSSNGFWLDAYNYDALVDWALKPAKETGAYSEGSLDHDRDRTVRRPIRQAAERSLILVDGTFRHRDELWQFLGLLAVSGRTVRHRCPTDG